MAYEIDIHVQRRSRSVRVGRIREAIEVALRAERVERAVISVTIVDNKAIHKINRDHLQHDYPTDVISFPLELEVEPPRRGSGKSRSGRIQLVEGEIIASAQMAEQMAKEGLWTPPDELILYVVHGLLHLCGYDDVTPELQKTMRKRERFVLAKLGLTPTYAAERD